MDLNEITDLTVLKALAYEQVMALEVAQQNLQNVQQRLEQLQTEAAAEATKPTAKK